jgi:16S rRNA C1402 (ribose-2'-O) methylase RsmI
MVFFTEHSGWSSYFSKIANAFGKSRLITLAVDLTMPAECLLHGPVGDIAKKVVSRKGEFILIVH